MPGTEQLEPVTVDTFVRAETDRYFAQFAAAGLGALHHRRRLPSVADQQVVRMNLDTLYSTGVFDLDASPVTVTLPDAGGRYLSLQPISQDHFTSGCLYGRGPFTISRDSIGTRYAGLLVRTFVDARDADDLSAVHALQGAIVVEQEDRGSFEVPSWDGASLDTVRRTLLRVAPALRAGEGFGARGEVDPIHHLVLTAAGWGGNTARDATYAGAFPEDNDGRTPYRLTVGDVPVDGFWSITVYDDQGYLAANSEERYSVNGVTAVPDPSGTVTVQFGGSKTGAPNWLPVPPNWNYVVRLYQPRPEILQGGWIFPAARPLPATSQ
jgi:hypothetical protein